MIFWIVFYPKLAIINSTHYNRIIKRAQLSGRASRCQREGRGFDPLCPLQFMSDLLNKKCVPCEGGVIPFDISEIHKYQKKVDGWSLQKDVNEIFFLEKDFKFKNFVESQNFVNDVGKISEEEGHHPDILFGWGYAEIKITTHAIEGLSENDFILAAKIDNISV